MNSNNAAISQIINRIDELVDAADPATILMGTNPQSAAAAVKEARKHWHTAKKLETVERLIGRGELIGGSQKNQDIAGATQRQLRTILTSEAKSRGFNKAELAQVKKSVMGTPALRTMHALGGLLPRDRLTASVHGVVALASWGASLGPPAAGAAIGWSAQKTAEALARKSVADLTRLIANGGIPPQTAKNVLQLLAESKREALSRALMAAGIGQVVPRYDAPRHEQ
jgi:hypothetical protein